MNQTMQIGIKCLIITSNLGNENWEATITNIKLKL